MPALPALANRSCSACPKPDVTALWSDVPPRASEGGHGGPCGPRFGELSTMDRGGTASACALANSVKIVVWAWTVGAKSAKNRCAILSSFSQAFWIQTSCAVVFGPDLFKALKCCVIKKAWSFEKVLHGFMKSSYQVFHTLCWENPS